MICVRSEFQSGLSYSRRSRSSGPRCRGASLVELMVVIVLMTVTLVSVGTLFSRVMSASRESERDLHLSLAIGRFAELVTRDVHAARDVTISAPEHDGSVTVTCLLSPDDVIDYRLTAAGILRQATRNQAAKPVREQISLPACRVHCRKKSDVAVGDVVEFTIERPAASLTPLRQTENPSVIFTLSVLPGRTNPHRKETR